MVRFKIGCLLAIVYCIPSSLCWAIPSDKLIAEAKLHDNQQVLYEGELIGSVLGRGDFAWLNLNDGANAIGVWVPSAMAQAVNSAGHYRHRGDLVEVSGIFHRSCSEHGGGLDIHAEQLAVIKGGEVLPETISKKKNLAVVILLGVFACLLIFHILRERQKRR